MTEINPDLVEVLSKIYYRELTESWTPTDAQWKLIENATGEEIVEIVYKKHWLMKTLLLNADSIVEEHNEKVERKVLRDLKKMRKDLRFCPVAPVRKTKSAAQDSETVEQRLVQETIDEIVENVPVERSDIADIFKELQRRDILKPGEGFSDENYQQQGTPSLQRDMRQTINFTPEIGNISLPEIASTPLNMDTIPGIEPFGEINLEELGKSGMLEGSYGQKIFSALQNRQSLQDVPRKTIEQSAQLDEENRHRGESMMKSISPKVLKAIRTSNVDFNLEAVASLEQPEPALPLEAVEHNNANKNKLPALQTAGMEQIKAPHLSRRELFEQFAAELEQKKNEQKLQTKKKVRRHRPKRSPVSTRHDNDVLELNLPLIRHKRKQKAPKLCLPEVQMKIILDVFDDIEDYVDDDSDWGDVDAEYIECMEAALSQIPLQDAKNIGMASPPKVSTQNVLQDSHRNEVMSRQKKPLDHSAVTKLPEAPKSPVEHIATIPSIQIDDCSPETFEEHANNHDHRLSDLPSIQTDRQLRNNLSNVQINKVFSPKISSFSNAKPSKFRLTEDEIRLGELRNLALPAEELINVDTIVENMRLSRLSRTSQFLKTPQTATLKKFRYVKGPYQLATNKFLDVQTNDGSFKRHSLYAMETIGLYLQIRIILARNKWRMKFADIFPQLKLLENLSEKVLESRLWALADYGFLKLHWDDEEENIVDVEITTN